MYYFIFYGDIALQPVSCAAKMLTMKIPRTLPQEVDPRLMHTSQLKKMGLKI